MTDIDFDELDKAVNSLMNKATNNNNPTPSASNEPEPDTAQADLTDQPTQNSAQVQTSPTISKKPSGRFMDVVHPSSDMRRGPVASAPSRTGVFIQPADSIKEEIVAEKTDSQEDLLNNNLDAPNEPVEKSLTDKIAESLADSSKKSDGIFASTSMDTPFLPNPNVEKRPLGGTSETDLSTTQNTPNSLDNDLVESEADRSQDAGSTEESLKPEFSKEILAVEQMSDEESPVGDKTVDVSEKSDDLQNNSVSSRNFGDIMPQYTAEEEPVANPAPIFEAASSTSGVGGQERKRSGWLTVLLILLFLLIGIGGGAAAWWFMIK